MPATRKKTEVYEKATVKKVRDKRSAIPENRKAVARVKLAELAAASKAADEDARLKKQKLFTGIYKAFNAGLGYVEMGQIVGVSTVRVGQILQQTRDQNGVA
jgi:hypothetical protein